MPVIEIGKAIDTYGIAVVTAILLGLIVWLIKHFVTQQDKTMKEVIGMSKVEMKAIGNTMEKMQETIQKGNSTNSRLNRKSIRMIANLAEYVNRHFNSNSDRVNFREKVSKVNEKKR